MDVSVIIVNYNTLALTMQCVDSIYQMTNGIKFEIIIVDNASTDGSVELLTNEFGDSITIFVFLKRICKMSFYLDPTAS